MWNSQFQQCHAVKCLADGWQIATSCNHLGHVKISTHLKEVIMQEEDVDLCFQACQVQTAYIEK
jgi:hypothetical protein